MGRRQLERLGFFLMAMILVSYTAAFVFNGPKPAPTPPYYLQSPPPPRFSPKSPPPPVYFFKSPPPPNGKSPPPPYAKSPPPPAYNPKAPPPPYYRPYY
ncbi:hypothetical protein R1flu_011365 [Riccia fluitans]|uniref:Extensin n=1 Tax=Riccia fluitans TaxID=41844 RepID=A0ABD1Z7T1_9MARC